MDPTAFDALAHAVARLGTRRWLLTQLAALPLGSALATLGGEAAAQRPVDRLRQRTQQRNRKQRNRARHGNHPRASNAHNHQNRETAPRQAFSRGEGPAAQGRRGEAMRPTGAPWREREGSLLE